MTKTLMAILILVAAMLWTARTATAQTIDAAPVAAAAAEPVKPEAEAPAAPVAEEKPMDTASKVIRDIKAGDWRHAAAGLLTLLMFGWNYARKNLKFLKGWASSDRGGAISLLALAIAGGLVTALASQEKLGAWVLLGAVWTAVEAAGFFTLTKTIIRPRDKQPEPAEA